MQARESTALKEHRKAFKEFIDTWDLQYKRQISSIKLFSAVSDCALTQKQKVYFVKVFYHIRGHFHDFLWHMGNHAPNGPAKKIILENISEEFGGDRYSHEQLYYNFSKSLGVDIKQEIVSESAYDEFVINFNKGHLEWLIKNDWISNLAAFSAYEHLDNIDYPVLSSLARRIGTPDHALLFFTVHEKVKHFDSLLEVLLDAWVLSSEKVIQGFEFISRHQLAMWNGLSNKIFAHGCQQE